MAAAAVVALLAAGGCRGESGPLVRATGPGTATPAPDDAAAAAASVDGSTPVAADASAAAPSAAPVPAAAPLPPPAPGTVEAVWAATPADACLLVSDGANVVFAANADTSVIPASTLKVVTAAAALDRLGADHRMRTRVVAATPPVAGIVEGDLFLVGGGDPVLGTHQWRASLARQPRLTTSLEQLADAVAGAGVREVRGSVRGDDSRYDALRVVPTWPRNYVGEGQTGALSALSVNEGYADWNGDDKRVEADPAGAAAATFNELLRQRGVHVVGGPGAGVAPPSNQEIAHVDSPPVAHLLGEMLQLSDNGTAELLVKELGRVVTGDGSTAAGAKVVVESLRRLGVPTDGVTVVDGSGLDRGNRLTCRALVGLLQRLDPHGVIANGLPVAARTGTLSKRYLAAPAAGRLRAKTGSLRNVSSLAGEVLTTSNRRLTFAYVQNGGPLPEAKARQDELGNVLALAP